MARNGFVMAKISPKAQKFISKKISKNIKEGRPSKQAQAIAFSQARQRGFIVPKAMFFDGKRFVTPVMANRPQSLKKRRSHTRSLM